MKIKILFLILVFLSTFAWSKEEPNVKCAAKTYSYALARNNGDKTIGVFGIGEGLFLNLQYEKVTIDAYSETSLNFISGIPRKGLGYMGRLDFRFSMFFPNMWEPFIISYNEYDKLGQKRWLGYTGAGLSIYAVKNKQTHFILSVASVFQYEDTTIVLPNRRWIREYYFYSSYLNLKFDYRFLNKVLLVNELSIIPVYNFSEVRAIFKIGLICELYKHIYGFYNEEREMNLNFEMFVTVDTFYSNKEYFGRTDYIWSTACNFVF